jgi:hypothetical protein
MTAFPSNYTFLAAVQPREKSLPEERVEPLYPFHSGGDSL